MPLSGRKSIYFQAMKKGTRSRPPVKGSWRNTVEEAIEDNKLIGGDVWKVQFGSPVRKEKV